MYMDSREFSSIIFGFVCAFAYFLYVRYRKRRNLYKDFNELHGPISIPFLGSVHLLLGPKSSSDCVDVLNRLLRDYQPPLKITLGPYLFYITNDPEELEIILRDPGANQKLHQYRVLEKALGQGLITASGETWKKNRKLIEPIFNRSLLNNCIPIIVEKSEELLTSFKEQEGKGFFNIHPLMNNCALSVIFEFVLGINKKDADNVIDYADLVSKYSSIAYSKVFNPLYHLDMIYKWTSAKEEEIIRKSRGFIEEIINRRIHQLRLKSKSNETETDNIIGKYKFKLAAYFDWIINSINQGKNKHIILLDLLLENSRFDSSGLKQIRDELTTFLMAGYDTTAYNLAMNFIMLGMFPEVQVKVYEEIIDVIGHDRNVEPQDLSKLNYLGMVIKETMRLFPISYFFGRYLQDNIKLKKRTLPKGLSVVIPWMQIQRNEKFWPEPLKFEPERFTPEECAKRHPYTWLPFSAGPRNCIGMHLALMEIKIVIATTIRKYVITTAYNSIEDIRLTPNIVNELIDGYNCSVELRQKK